MRRPFALLTLTVAVLAVLGEPVETTAHAAPVALAVVADVPAHRSSSGTTQPDECDGDTGTGGVDDPNERGTAFDRSRRGAAAEAPGQLLDLTDWKLTLPRGAEGSPEEIRQPELQEFTAEGLFELTPEGDGVALRAPVGGATTEKSEYPRTELREMFGEENAAWSSATGTHALEVCQAITETPKVKPEVVAAQIHDGEDDVMQIRLEGQTLTAQYADGDKQIIIDDNYKLGTRYDLRLVVADGRVGVFYNGELKAEFPASGDRWHYKVGDYTQSNGERGEAPDAAGEVVIYSLSVEHQDGAGGRATAPTGKGSAR